MFKSIIFTLFILFASANSLSQEYKEVPIKQNRSSESSFFAEILNRTPTVNNDGSRGTSAHENIHFINAEYSNLTFGKQRAFYITGEKRVFYSTRPRLFKNDVRAFVPAALRGARYVTYIEQQQGWNDVPTYIMDEWVAYIGGGMVALEDFENKTHRDISDRISGALEFSVYTVALCMAIQEKDPEFWQRENAFRGFVKDMLDKSYDLFQRGRFVRDFQSQKQEDFFDALQKSPEAAKIRDFLREWFDGVWLQPEKPNFI